MHPGDGGGQQEGVDDTDIPGIMLYQVRALTADINNRLTARSRNQDSIIFFVGKPGVAFSVCLWCGWMAGHSSVCYTDNVADSDRLEFLSLLCFATSLKRDVWVLLVPQPLWALSGVNCREELTTRYDI